MSKFFKYNLALLLALVVWGAWTARPVHTQEPSVQRPQAARAADAALFSFNPLDQCYAPDDGSGTVQIPPASCTYVSPDEVYQIIDGLPPGTTIELAPVHKAFYCPYTGDVGPCQGVPGGDLGGETHDFEMTIVFRAVGTGDLSGWERLLILYTTNQIHSGPRVPGDPVQAFDTVWYSMAGALSPGDPDFTTLQLAAGNAFGLPSPGHTTLTSLGNGYFHVDSFFDISYQITFQGAPGGALDGLAGTTTGTIRIQSIGAKNPCLAADDGTGSAEFPPSECDYSPLEPMFVLGGLPPGTTIEIEPLQTDFSCLQPGCGTPGGDLGGEVELFDSTWVLQLSGTGDLDGFRRTLRLDTSAETHSGPRTPGDAMQGFDTNLVDLQGDLTGDPDFASFSLTAGSSSGLPGPGWTLLTNQGDGTFWVDSFFDIIYQIDFVGAPGGALEGLAGTTQGKVSHNAREGTRPSIELDNGRGTVSLPPSEGQYQGLDDVLMIIDGLPPGTHIGAETSLKDFVCQTSPCGQPGGSLGGEVEQFEATLELLMAGIGDLAGLYRRLSVPVSVETHSAPRAPGDPTQIFDTDLFSLQGSLLGDPDFAVITVTAGTDNGLPSPGHTTLTDLGDGTFQVDSFFDITYRIDFEGAPGGALDGLSGSTAGVARLTAFADPDKTRDSDVFIVKSVDPPFAAPGELITYTLTFSNAGSHVASGARITDIISSQYFAQSSPQSSITLTPTGSSDYAWLVPDLAPDEGGVITISAQLRADLSVGDVLTNAASIAPSTVESDMLNNSAEVQLPVLHVPRSPLFSDGFESGDTSAWSSTLPLAVSPSVPLRTGLVERRAVSPSVPLRTGLVERRAVQATLDVTTTAALDGAWGLQVTLDGSMAQAFVRDSSPYGASYRARFLFDPATVSMSSGSQHDIFVGQLLSEAITKSFRLEFGYLAPDFRVRALLTDDQSVEHSTQWHTVSDTVHAFEIMWWTADAPGVDSGGLHLLMDDSLQESLLGIDNDGQSMRWASLGAVSGLDATSSGSYYVDAFESWISLYADLGMYKAIKPSTGPSSGSGESSGQVPTAAPGDIITYTLTFSNTGNDVARGVVITDEIPLEVNQTSFENLPGLSVTATGSFSYVWLVEDLSPDEIGVITITGQLSDDLDMWTSVVNTATIATSSDDSDSANDSSQALATLCLEQIVVSNADDSGDGSLRQAISDACQGASITFDDDYEIYLDSTLFIDKELSIDGSGQGITLSGDSGNDGSRDVQVFYIGSGGVVTLNRLSVVSGTSTFGGGGIYNLGTLTVSNSALAGNEVTSDTVSYGGGGISNRGTATVGNSTFAGNAAPQVWGGGVSNADGAVLTLVNSTLAANTANTGGGLYNSGGATLHLQNTIVAGNSGGDCDGVLATNTNNLIQDGSCSPALFGEPMLSALGDYGPLTDPQVPPTFALLPGSPAIDAGDAAACASAPVNGLDQRGVGRPQGASCDVGAFESQGYSLHLSGGDQQLAAINTPFPQPLQVTVREDVSDVAVGPGTLITFSAPSSGASLVTTNFTTTTDANGVALASVTANGLTGAYVVTATAQAISQPVYFDLSNRTPYTLSVHVTGAGAGSVDPTGGVYPQGQVITLTATPATGSYLAGWSGDIISTTNPLVFIMDDHKTITATFELLSYTLTVHQAGDATGDVRLEPAGGVYEHGTVVTLTVTFSPGVDFGGWTGDLQGTANPGALFMDSDKVVTAHFALVQFEVYLPLVLRQSP